ncbi:copper uptake system-associated protein [Bradyrhizobium sp. SZCCHNS2005]|uniref:copper uptake system-associated protein n=1 Tax=Bradyrhizobium sp. SZCCHNS2005 TaxID=3057303 RepID=UPI0028E5DCDF|nr:copper uptake system-associated protein [Bradyrhizobium sp. SZCCHNS2005]
MAILKVMMAAALLVRADAAFAGADQDAVRDVLMAAFDKPEARLVVDPVVVSGAHAIADWTQGATGGRALLRRGAKGWSLVLCAGDGIKDSAALKLAGVPAPEAAELVAALIISEQELPRDRLALLSSFEGVVSMDGAHPYH